MVPHKSQQGNFAQRFCCCAQAVEVRHIPGRAAGEQKQAVPLPSPGQSQAAGLGAAGAGPAALLPAKTGWENRESGRGEAC